MQLLRYIIRPLSPWITPLRSDTLYGLLLCRINERNGSDSCSKAINAFREGNPPFILSSALPLDKIYNPRLPPTPRRLFKQWVDKKVFRNAQGEALSMFQALEAQKRFRKEPFIPLKVWIDNASSLSLRPLLSWFCTLKPTKMKTTSQSIEPHVSIDRRQDIALSGGLFFNSLTWFSEKTAFHIYARTSQPEELLSLLREVGELGFGKDASTGKGRFAVEIDEYFDQNLENTGTHKLLCSVCASMDMSSLDGWYTIDSKRAKAAPSVESPHKAPMLVIQEGSILKSLPNGPYVLEGINKNSSIVQIGQPLTLPCCLSKEEYCA